MTKVESEPRRIEFTDCSSKNDKHTRIARFPSFYSLLMETNTIQLSSISRGSCLTLYERNYRSQLACLYKLLPQANVVFAFQFIRYFTIWNKNLHLCTVFLNTPGIAFEIRLPIKNGIHNENYTIKLTLFSGG